MLSVPQERTQQKNLLNSLEKGEFYLGFWIRPILDIKSPFFCKWQRK